MKKLAAHIFLIILSGLQVLPAKGEIIPSDKNCNFYLDMEKDLGCWFRESDDSDYLVKYGYKFCSIFKNKAVIWNDDRSDWVKKTSLCLQDAVKDFKSPANCRKLEDDAFDAHPSCYRKGQFCRLTKWKRTTIVSTAFGIDVLLKPIKSFSQGFRLLKECFNDVPSEASALYERANSLASDTALPRDQLASLFWIERIPEAATLDYFRYALRKMLGEGHGISEQSMTAYTAIYGHSQGPVMDISDLRESCKSKRDLSRSMECRDAVKAAGSLEAVSKAASVSTTVSNDTLADVLAYKKRLEMRTE